VNAMRFTPTKLSAAFAASVLVFASQAFAITFEITAPCSKEVAAQGRYELPMAPMPVGAATILILEAEGLPYIGSDRGLNSLLQTPVGVKAMESISDNEMRAYGWCYEVNGKIPDELAFQYKLKGPEHLRWFYGYAEYKDGEWISFCNPTAASTNHQHCR
jgi:Domain of unknown function (DUF4430)